MKLTKKGKKFGFPMQSSVCGFDLKMEKKATEKLAGFMKIFPSVPTKVPLISKEVATIFIEL